MPIRWLAALLATTMSAAGQDEPNPSFYLANEGKAPIAALFATPAGTRMWGDNRLPNSPLRARHYAAIRLPADGNCLYDLRIVYADGHAQERHDLDVCAVDSVTLPSFHLAPAASVTTRDDDPSFILVNRGRTAMRHLFLSVTTDDNWGVNRLGSDMLPGGVSRVIRVPPGGCVYDLRVVFADGRISERRNLNLCETINLAVP